MRITNKPSNLAAFTLVELLVAMLVSSILISVTISTYTLFRSSLSRDQSKASLSQNARVALDRISRELRQTAAVVTQLPASTSDTSVAQPHEIEFEDGHANDTTYKRYYVSNGILKMESLYYSFSYAPSTKVDWNSIGNGGVSPIRRVQSTQDIAELVQSISFYGANPLQVQITTSDGSQSFVLRTSIVGRNI